MQLGGPHGQYGWVRKIYTDWARPHHNKTSVLTKITVSTSVLLQTIWCVLNKAYTKSEIDYV